MYETSRRKLDKAGVYEQDLKELLWEFRQRFDNHVEAVSYAIDIEADENRLVMLVRESPGWSVYASKVVGRR